MALTKKPVHGNATPDNLARGRRYNGINRVDETQPVTRRVLALDLGTRRIGLALSDPLGLTAQGLPTLERKNNRTDFAALTRLAARHGVTSFLIGHPLNMSGDPGRQAEWARE